MQNKQKRQNNAFTLLELLVVMAIIAALVSILSVGLRTVKIKATNLRQKGEFHGMEISIELFQNDFDRYPDSSVVEENSTRVCGAQRLAEAMEGRDERGFHPKSKWHPDLEPSPPDDLYTEDTLKERKPVYFELKHSGFFTPGQLWGTGNTGNLYEDSPLITDVFVRNIADDTAIDEKVGSPVLYFKADSTKRFRLDRDRQFIENPEPDDYKNWIYNFDDNIDLLGLTWLRDPGEDTDTGIPPHYPDEDNDGVDDEEPDQLFYEIITQRADPDMNFYKSYNKDTFILISAGWDGLYGTKDDLTNFND